jgi:lysozyme
VKLSDTGLQLILRFEGKLQRLPNGRYQAYRCPANVPTIYAGCTEGVTMGMIVTEQEGEEMFRREIEKFEKAVALACTREPNQYQFDAFVSLAYNIGAAGFRKSSVLRHFNAGNDDKAAAAFALWNKGGGRVLKGLVRRRAAESALFLRPVEPPPMPQKVDESMSSGDKATATVGTTLGLGGAAYLADPVSLSSTLVAVKGNGQQLFAGVDLTTFGVPLVIIIAAIAAAWFLGRK